MRRICLTPFPSGMFDSLEGMQVAGKLNYNLNIIFKCRPP